LEDALNAPIGKLLIALGAVLVVAGAVLVALDRLGARMPGDLSFEGHGWKVAIPCGTMLLVSLLLTLLLDLFARMR